MLSPSCVIYCSNTNCSNSKDILICNSCYSNGGYNCLLFIIRYLLFWGLRNYAKERKHAKTALRRHICFLSCRKRGKHRFFLFTENEFFNKLGLVVVGQIGNSRLGYSIMFWSAFANYVFT